MERVMEKKGHCLVVRRDESIWIAAPLCGSQ
jgi:hypothetical protein